ncbi:MAG: AraC family transcriptional regulator [Deltaproteobacteria bacterium]|nr:AraC family transcriptional regulator [Deltaproteobacteria bacterium]
MSSLEPLLNRLLEKYQHTAPSGSSITDIPGVYFFWSTEELPRTPLLYSASIVIIGQGFKIGYLGDRKFRYDRETYLVLGVPIPFECETHASLHEPLLGISIDIDVAMLHELVSKFSGNLHLERSDTSTEPHTGVEPVQMSSSMIDATTRLLSCLNDPLDSRILGNAAVGEIVYRVLRDKKGHVLYNLTQHQTPYAAVARALERIHTDYRETLTVEDLAKETAMSVSSFHRAFKRVTGESPLQYLKKIRLDKARSLLVHDKMRVNNVAFEVGYESPSQFSREFKRYFNVPPSDAHTIAYSYLA